jgi:Flp pilus assembly protein TadG
MPKKRKPRLGNALIEFTLIGIPIIFITLSIVGVSLDMWEYHNLAYASEMTARYVTVHGATCSANGNSCTITVAKVASYFATQAMALDAAKVIVKMTDGSGTTTCSPVSSCYSFTSTQFPNASYNSVGSDVRITATYVLRNPLMLYWPPDVDPDGTFTVGATSRQPILF